MDNFKKFKNWLHKKLVYPTPAYVEQGQKVILQLPNGNDVAGTVERLKMYKGGWKYSIRLDSRQLYTLQHLPTATATRPVNLKAYSAKDNNYYQVAVTFDVADYF